MPQAPLPRPPRSRTSAAPLQGCNPMSDLRTDARSISRLLGDAFEQLSQLFQTEIRLPRAELADKAAPARGGAGLLFAGLLVMMPALVLLLIALALFLTGFGLSPVTAHLLSG